MDIRNKKIAFTAAGIVAVLSLAVTGVVLLTSKPAISMEADVDFAASYNLELNSQWTIPEQESSNENPVGFYDFNNIYENSNKCFIGLEQMRLEGFKDFKNDYEGTVFFAFPLGVPVLGKLDKDSFTNVNFAEMGSKVQMALYKSRYDGFSKYMANDYNMVQATRVSASSKIMISVVAGCPKDSEFDPADFFSEVTLAPSK